MFSGETIEACAKREVFEETGIEAEFISVLSFRHQTEFRYGCADFYFSCLMKPTRPDQPIRLCEQEIGAGQWMEVCIVKFLNFWTSTKFTVSTLKFKLRGSTMVCNLKMMQMEKQTMYTLIRLLRKSDLGLHCLPKPVCPKI